MRRPRPRRPASQEGHEGHELPDAEKHSVELVLGADLEGREERHGDEDEARRYGREDARGRLDHENEQSRGDSKRHEQGKRARGQLARPDQPGCLLKGRLDQEGMVRVLARPAGWLAPADVVGHGRPELASKVGEPIPASGIERGERVVPEIVEAGVEKRDESRSLTSVTCQSARKRDRPRRSGRADRSATAAGFQRTPESEARA